jgi:hypothetical protein
VLTAEHDVFISVRVLPVTRLRLAVRHGQQCRLSIQLRLVRQPLHCDLLQRFDHRRILQQRLAASREHGDLGDRLGEVLLHWRCHDIEVRLRAAWVLEI